MHVAFLTSQAVLLLSPIYQHYVEADYCKCVTTPGCSALSSSPQPHHSHPSLLALRLHVCV